MTCRAVFAARFLSFLDAQGIAYSVVGSGRRFGQRIEGDIDIVVDPDAVPTLAQHVSQFCVEQNGWLVHAVRRGRNGGYFVCVWTDETGTLLRLDLDICGDYSRDGCTFLSAQEILAGRTRTPGEPGADPGYYVAAPANEFIYSLVKQIDKQIVTDHAAAHLCTEWSTDREGALAKLTRFWSGRELDLLIRALETNNWAAVRARLPQLRKSLRFKVHSSSSRFAPRVFTSRLRRWLHPSGLCVAFLGPDGSGKTSVIDRVVPALAPAFREVWYYHLHPNVAGLRKRERRTASQKPVRKSGWSLASLAKLGYFVLDYSLGYPRHVWPRLRRTALVIFDRYSYDLSIDPVTLGYQGPMSLARHVSRLFPQPNLFVLLDAPVETLQARKQEVPGGETARQRSAYLQLVRGLPNGHVVDASRTLDQVAIDVERIILGYMAERTARRLGLAVSAQKRPSRVPTGS